jgi:site-specific DNA-methyltransferase (adenine-specific)
VRVDKGEWDASHGVGSDHAFQTRWLEAVRRTLKPSGTIWVSGTQHVIFSIGYAMQELGFHLLNTVTWYKPNASPNLACRSSPLHRASLGEPIRAARCARFNYRDMKERNGGKQMRDVGVAAGWGGCPMTAAGVDIPPRRGRKAGRHPPRSRWRWSLASSGDRPG